MRVLVTGAAGFIGGWLCAELRQAGHSVMPIDKVHGDLTIPGVFSRQLRNHQPDVVVHLAAQVGRLFGEDDLAHTVASNAVMTTLVANACGQAGVRLVYASTSEIYGDNGDAVCQEEDGPFSLPHNLYGVSKGWGEDACELYATDGLTVWRISMPYGPGLPAGRGRAALINFLYNALHGDPITVHRNSERSWCWIGDTVRAMRLTIESGAAGAWNIGRDDNAVSMREVALLACEATGASPELIVEVDAPGRQTVVKRLSTQKIRGLGWAPTVELGEGMEQTLAYVRTLPAPLAVAA